MTRPAVLRSTLALYAALTAPRAAARRRAAARPPRRPRWSRRSDRFPVRRRWRRRSPRRARRENPYAGNRTATTEGRQLFVRFNCSGCHGGRAGGGMGPSLRDVDWLYGNRDAQLFSSIAEGRAHGMPSWQPRLTADQIWKLVTYIKSLRTRNEPNPPPSE